MREGVRPAPQALRAVGGNAWRMAHNPPIPARLDLMDALGMLAMDENRDYGGRAQQVVTHCIARRRRRRRRRRRPLERQPAASCSHLLSMSMTMLASGPARHRAG